MSVHAGEILHVGGNNVIDRIQSAGLGDVNLPIETIREVGNREVVDKIPGEPDFTFTLESFDVSTDLMAWLTGSKPGTSATSAGAPGEGDAEGTAYDWLDCVFVNVPSPWKDPASGEKGDVEAGHLIPGYYPTRLRYRFGVTDNATQEVELAGGSFYYAEAAPVEQFETGNGATKNFASDNPAIHLRRGGSEGSTFRAAFGVLVDGQLQTEDVDYEVEGGAEDPGSTVTIKFLDAPANNALISFCYFTSAAMAYPQSVHASVIVKPGAVRGRNIKVLLDGKRLGGIQSAELEATVEGEVERELGTEEIVGRSNTGTDCNGSLTIRAKDRDAFFDDLETMTGVSRKEVYGWFNDKTVDLQIRIENPRNPGVILKTIRVEDAKFQPPGTPARVNTPTDFQFSFSSTTGTFKEVKGVPA
jgi:hypothetical protein